MFKRVGLFLFVNVLVVTSISLLLNLFHVAPYLSQNGINYSLLLVFCFIWGSTGSIISLLASKMIAKKVYGVKLINQTSINPVERKLLMMVHSASKKAGLTKMPEVGYYHSNEINAFATGATRNSSLVAVSSGLIENMQEHEVEGVIGHEVGHIANGDMVTMTLLQGVVNSFVMFLSRIIAFVFVSDKKRGVSWMAFFVIQMTIEMVLMVLGSVVISYFSRRREYRADAYSAKLVGKSKMISALKVLQQKFEPIEDHGAFKTMQIASGDSWFGLFSTHPKLSKRIKALEKSI
jgi:heat shock protein HtpX